MLMVKLFFILKGKSNIRPRPGHCRCLAAGWEAVGVDMQVSLGQLIAGRKAAWLVR